jgi:hypothetical protein
MLNADSATNMLWLINQATAGQITSGQVPTLPSGGGKEGEKKEGLLAGGKDDLTFTNIKIDANA